MKDSRFGNPVGGQPVHPLPREAIFLATPPQRAQPNTLHIVVECFQRSSVGRHCVVGEEASDDLLDPSPLLGDWLMHPPSQLVLDLPLSVARMRSRRVILFTRNCPRLLRSQMKVKPRKAKVSGFPSPR